MFLFGSRAVYRLMNPEPNAGGGGAGGDNPPNPNPNPAPSNPPTPAPTDIAKELANIKDSLLSVTQENSNLKKQLHSMTNKSIDDKIKNETDPTKVVDLLKNSLLEQESQNKQLKKQILSSNIKSTLQRVAGDRVHDVSDLLNQPEFSGILKASIDSEKMDVDETVAKTFVDKLLERKPYLQKKNPVAGAHNQKPASTSQGKAVSEMTAEEITNELMKNWNNY